MTTAVAPRRHSARKAAVCSFISDPLRVAIPFATSESTLTIHLRSLMGRKDHSGSVRPMADLGPWEPLSPDDAQTVLSGVPFVWWLAGGWSLDLLIGRPTRDHHDIDVTVLRPELAQVRDSFAAWDLHVADPPGTGTLRLWPLGTMLGAELHDVWCRRRPGEAWCLQIMVDDVDGDAWMYRRDIRIRRPVASLSGRASRPGCAVLSPEIQLLYKSEGLREKDQADFDRFSALLTEEERTWLRGALELASPEHPWLDCLAQPPTGL